MNTIKTISYILLIASLFGIIIGFFTSEYVTLGLAIVCIPIFILSFGLLNMAKPKKDEMEERVEEPFTGY
jgi:energy-converting hydrogenase A subunit I